MTRLFYTLILCAAAAGVGCAPFSIREVTPAEIPAGEESTITVGGVGFSDGVAFSIEAPGLEVTVTTENLTETSVDLRVPAAIPAGTYSIVATLDGQQARLDDALKVVEGTARFVFIDVSQGDATLILTPTGETILIDGGKRDASTAVQTALADYAGGGIDVVIVSHFDADHLGGVVELLMGPDGRPGGVDDVIVPIAWSPQDQNTCGTVTCQDMRQLRTDFVAPSVGDRLEYGDFSLEVVAVGGDIGAGPVAGAVDENERSLVVVANFGGRKVAITGDITGGGLGTVDLESPLAQRIGTIDVVQVAHHGSATSSPLAAIDAYQARAAVFSMGRDNSFCHPESSVFTRWDDSGTALYGTTSGIVDDAQSCGGRTPTPQQGRFGVGDVVLDVDASGAMFIDGDVLVP